MVKGTIVIWRTCARCGASEPFEMTSTNDMSVDCLGAGQHANSSRLRSRCCAFGGLLLGEGDSGGGQRLGWRRK